MFTLLSTTRAQIISSGKKQSGRKDGTFSKALRHHMAQPCHRSCIHCRIPQYLWPCRPCSVSKELHELHFLPVLIPQQPLSRTSSTEE